eukprot:498475_1
MTLSTSERQIAATLSISASALSFLAEIIILTTIWMGTKGYCFGTLRGVKISRISFHFIAMISISDGIRTFSHLFGAPESDRLLCGFQTFLKIFGGMGSFIWISFIAYTVYKLVVQSDKYDATSIAKYKKTFHAIAWSFAFICAIIPTATGYYENAYGWCFIQHLSTVGAVFMVLCYYLWVIVIWIFIAIVYSLIYRHVQLNGIIWDRLPTVRKLMYYPIIFFCCWFWALLRRAWNTFDPGNVPFVI